MTQNAFSFTCSARAAEEPRVLAPPPFLYATALGAAYLLQSALATVAAPGRGARLAGWALVAAGTALAGSFLAALVRARTSPDFKRASRLVTTGPYRFSRNPGYLGMAVAYAGIAVVTGTWWAFATLLPALVAIDRCVVRAEERHLESRFGDAYRAYAARVRRWV